MTALKTPAMKGVFRGDTGTFMMMEYKSMACMEIFMLGIPLRLSG